MDAFRGQQFATILQSVYRGNTLKNDSYEEEDAFSKNLKKKIQESGTVIHFPRRQEQILIEQLRANIKELRNHVERLSARNSILEQQMQVKEQQLQAAEAKLGLQKIAWNDLAKQQQKQQSRPSEPPLAGKSKVPPLSLTGVNTPEDSNQARSAPLTTSTASARRPLSAKPALKRPDSARQLPTGGLSVEFAAMESVHHEPATRRADEELHDADDALFSRQERARTSALAEEKNSSHTSSTIRPFSARNAPTTPAFTTPRTARPSTARAALASRTPVPVPPTVPKDPLFTKFKSDARTRDGKLSFGSFAANAVLSQRAAQGVLRHMSEQKASFESLGLFLSCTWSEVCYGTSQESSPNYFRLAVCCSIFDQVCGVVGMYSPLLFDLRKELYSCLFRGFDPDQFLPRDSPHDYTQLFPWFLECSRLEAERANHRSTIDKLKALEQRMTEEESER